MEVMGKVLSARLDSTLKDLAARSLSPKYSLAQATMASLSLGHARARHNPATPKSLPMACQAPSKSQLSFWGST